MFTWGDYVVLDAGFACISANNQEDDSVLLALWAPPHTGATMEDSLSRATGASIAGPEWDLLDTANRRRRLFAAVAQAAEQGCPGPLLAWLAAAAGCLAAIWEAHTEEV